MENQVQKLGTSELEVIVDFIGAGINVGDKVGRTTGLSRYGLLFGLAAPAAKLAVVDFKLAGEQLADLDEAEKADLFARAKADIVLDDKIVEAFIEEGIGLAIDLQSLVARVMKLVKAIKAHRNK